MYVMERMARESIFSKRYSIGGVFGCKSWDLTYQTVSGK
jgi:hypothetical protein